MALESVKEIMLPLDDYAVVDEEATMLEALRALDEAQRRLAPGRQPHRAVLVVDPRGEVVGKLGHLAFLSALEPRYDEMGDLPALSRVGLSAEFIDSGAGMARWGEPSEGPYRRRRTVLERFREKISRPNPKPSLPPRRTIRKPKFAAGDCLAVLLEDGRYGAALVLATDGSDPEHPADLVAELDYLADQPPAIGFFRRRRWLELTHHNWRGKRHVA